MVIDPFPLCQDIITKWDCIAYKIDESNEIRREKQVT